MDTNKKNYPGMALLTQLIKHSNDLNLDRKQLCNSIGITYPYLNALMNGHRDVSGIGLDKLRIMAKFLNISFIQVLMLAEIVYPEDFAQYGGEMLDNDLDKMYENLKNDPEWRIASPTEAEWKMLSRNSKIGYALMWETISKQTFIEKAKLILIDKSEPDSVDANKARTKAA